MTTRSPERGRALAAQLLVAATGLTLAVRTRKVWGDPVVDYGRELYLAWRLSEGAELYRDVAHFNGPLSGVVNALWFDLLGPGLTQLVALDLLVLAATTTVLFGICRSLGGLLAGTSAAIVFLGLQGFGYFGYGTYNFVTPYSHELTHGVLLGLVAVAAVGIYARTGRARWAFVVGGCAGLSLLTKPETALATCVAALVGLAATAWRPPPSHLGEHTRPSGSPRVAIAAACIGAVLPPLSAFSAFADRLGRSAAAEGLLRQWHMASDPRVTGLAFYRQASGLDSAGSNVLALAAWTLGGVAALGGLAWIARRVRAGRHGAALAAGAVAAASLAASAWVPWHRIWFVLPAAAAAALADSVVRLRRRRGRPSREITALVFATLALMLLAKQGLHPRIFHYGFAVTVPAVAVCVASLLGRVPARMSSGAGVFRGGALGLLTAVLLFHLGLSQAALRTATASSGPVGVGTDVLRADAERARVLQEVIERIRGEPAEATLAVLPEGAYLNFVLRRPNPTPFAHLAPPELITWGEEAVLDTYRRSPPDLVVLVHRDRGEYGLGPFGVDHGRLLVGWLRDNYRTVHVVGDRPFGEGARFGAELLERRSPIKGREPASTE